MPALNVFFFQIHPKELRAFDKAFFFIRRNSAIPSKSQGRFWQTFVRPQQNSRLEAPWSCLKNWNLTIFSYKKKPTQSLTLLFPEKLQVGPNRKGDFLSSKTTFFFRGKLAVKLRGGLNSWIILPKVYSLVGQKIGWMSWF